MRKNRYFKKIVTGICILIFSTTVAAGQGLAAEFTARASQKAMESGKKELQSLLLAGMKLKKDNPDSAIMLFRLLYQKGKDSEFPEGTANALLWTGSIYLARDEPHKAMAYTWRAYPLCLNAVKRKGELLLLWYNNMAAIYSTLEQYDSAMQYYFKALNDTMLPRRNTKVQITLLNNIGKAYYRLSQYEKAISYHIKAERLALQQGDTEALADIYHGLSIAHIVLNKTKIAASYLEKAKMYAPSNSFKSHIYQTMGYLHYKDSNYKKAISTFPKALFGNIDVKSKMSIFLGMGACYYHLGAYKQSEAYFLTALKNMDSTSISAKQQMQAYDYLGYLYDTLKSYKEASHYRKLAYNLKDTVNRLSNIKTLQELETLNQIQKNEREIMDKKVQLLTNTESLRKKNMWIGGIVVGALMVITSIIMLYQKQRLKLQKVINVQQQQKVAVLKAVIEGEEKERGRIGRELHDDIMVQLSIVKMGLEILPMNYPDIKHTEDYKNIAQQMDFVGQKIRQTAHNLMPDVLLEQGLISAIHYFCRNVEKLTALKIQVQHYGNIPRFPSDIEISIFRIAQELIQNILKHARATNALVQLNYRDHYLNLTVEDDGLGITPEIREQIASTGLISVRNRIKALNGDIDIHPRKPHGTSIHIEIFFKEMYHT